MLTEASLQHLQRLLREGKLNNLTDEEILSAIELLNQQKKIAVPSFEAAQAMVPVVQKILASCPHLLEPQYRGKEDPMTGHCYVGTEALFHMLGGYDQKTWGAETVSHEGGPHWFLRHKPSGKVIDPTASQFKTQVPYEQGIPKGMQPFYQFAKRTGNPNKMIPSQRTLEVILRVFNQAIESHKLTLATQAKKVPQTEAFHTALLQMNQFPYEVYKNPTRAEMRKIDPKHVGRYQLRGWLTPTEAYVWNPRYSAHFAMHQTLGLGADALPVLLYFGPGAVSVRVTDASRSTPYHHSPRAAALIKAHPWFRAIQTKIEDIDYYDSAIDGDWAEMTEAFLTSLVNSEGGQTVLIDVYKNPTMAELRELGDNLRGVITSKDAYLWAARGATHSDITDSVPEAKGGIHALFYFTPGLLKVHIPPYSHHPDDHVTLKRLKTLPWLSQLKLPIQVKIGFLSAPWEPLQLK